MKRWHGWDRHRSHAVAEGEKARAAVKALLDLVRQGGGFLLLPLLDGTETAGPDAAVDSHLKKVSRAYSFLATPGGNEDVLRASWIMPETFCNRRSRAQNFTWLAAWMSVRSWSRPNKVPLISVAAFLLPKVCHQLVKRGQGCLPCAAI